MSYKASKGDNTMHGFIRQLHYALKGYRELNLSLNLQPRTAYVKLDSLKRVNLNILPGFRGLTKVGIKEGDRIRTFQPDSTIVTIFDKDDKGKNQPNTEYADAIREKSGSNWFEVFFYNYIDGHGVWYNLLGKGNGHNGVGYFNYDRSTGYLFFSADVDVEYVYVEYIKDVYEIGAKTMVPEAIGNYLEEYIRWWEKRRKFGDSHKETIAQAMVMKMARDDAVMRTDDLSLDSITNILHRGISKMQ